MKLLDLFSGAGGAAMGYHQAGFEVTGVDHLPQPHYPFVFVQADALEYLAEFGQEYDVIHASPPCQGYSKARHIHRSYDHPDLVGETRDGLQKTGKPYVIENVPGAPLFNPLLLCGSMFPELRVYRHRLFEGSPILSMAPAMCNHSFTLPPYKIAFHTLDNHEYITVTGHNFRAEDGRRAMQIDWMTRDELAQAVPPAYTRYIGEQLQRILGYE